MKHKVRINESVEEKEIVTNENLETIENVTDEINDTVDNVIDTNNEHIDEPSVDEPVDETINESVDETINEPVDETINEPIDEPSVDEPVDEIINEPEVEEIVTKEGKVSCGKLNVRSAANKDADIISVIIKDNIVSILDDSDEVFYRISYNGNEGYCMKEFIELL